MYKIKRYIAVSICLFVLAASATAVSCEVETPEFAYELAIEKLDYETAQHWKNVTLDLNSEQAINELAFLPEEGRLVIADDVKRYTDNGIIEGKEFSDMADPDLDGIVSSKDTYPMDPSNTREISLDTFDVVRNWVKYRNFMEDERTLPEIYSGLERAIDAVESNPGLARYFTPQQSHIFASLVSGIPAISNYPKAMRLGAIQVDSQNLADDYAMKNFVIPAISYIIGLQEEGKIDVLNGLGIPDAALDDEGIRQILLPIELREVNIVSGERTSANIETGIYNVTFNEDLGKSPQEWLGEIAARDFNDKNIKVWEWIREIPTEYGPRDVWTNSYKAYCEYLKSVDDLSLFIRDYPIYLMNEQSGRIIPELTGQTAPYYSILVGRGFGEAVFDVRAIYPTTPNPDRPGIHSEPFRLVGTTSDSWLLPYRSGFWPETQAFIDDYKDKPYNIPTAEVRQADGTYKMIDFELD